MENIYSNDGKQIPKTLQECTKADETASKLYLWSANMEKWGQALLVFIIIGGIISTFEQVGNTNDDMKFLTFVISAGTWALYGIIEYCVCNALALLLSALASITQSAHITANVALYEAEKDQNGIKNEGEINAVPEKVQSYDWSKAYGKINRSSPSAAGMWKCKYCGTENSNNVSQCKKCGLYKS